MNDGLGVDRRLGRRTAIQVAVLTALLWAQTIVPVTIQSLSTDKRQTFASQTTQLTPFAYFVSNMLIVGVVALGAYLALKPSPSRPNFLWLLLFLPLGYLVIRDLYNGSLEGNSVWTYVLAVAAMWRHRANLDSAARTLGWLTGVTAALAMALGVLVPDSGIFRAASGDFATADKEILPWGLLSGMFGSPNNLGQFLSVGFPTILLVKRGWPRTVLLAIVALAIFWSASRSSLLAVAAAVLAVAIARAFRALTVRRVVYRVWLLLLGGILVLVPLATSDFEAFSGRGRIWAQSFSAVTQDPVTVLLGLGSDWYSRVAGVYNELGDDAFHGHNQFVQTFVTGGLVYVVLAAALALALIYGASVSSRSVFPLAYLSALFVSCTLEVSIGFVDRSFMYAVTVLPFIYLLSRAGQATPGAPNPTPALLTRHRV